MRPGEGASPAPRWGPHPSGPLREAPLGAPSAELAAPLPRGRRAGAEPRSWRQRRGRPGTTRAPLGSPERPPPGHVAAPASNHTGATYPSRAPRPKGEGARETKFKRGQGCQRRRQPTKKLPQCPSRPSIRPHPAPARLPPRPRPRRPRAPPAGGLGNAGRAPAQSPSPGPETAASGESTPNTSLGVVCMHLPAGSRSS